MFVVPYVLRFSLLILLLCMLLGCGEGDQLPPEDTGGASQASSQAASDRRLPAELGPIFRLIEAGQVEQARLRLQRYNMDHPNDGHGLFLFGLTFHVQNRFGQARTHFETASSLLRGYPPLHYFYGWCLYHLGDLDEARAEFQQHLEYEPAEADSHYALGLIALDQDRLNDAKEALSRAVLLLEDDPQRQRDLGRAHGKLGEAMARSDELQSARQHLETAAEVYPDDHESLYQLYRVLLRLGDEDAAANAQQRHQQARERANLPAPAND